MTKNYFQLFDLENLFDIDREKLNKKYKELQKQYHPDQIQKKPQQKIDTTITSSYINNAYNILKDNYLRAKYLLEISGYALDDSSLNNRLTNDELESILNEFEYIDTNENKILLQYKLNEYLNNKELLLNELARLFTLTRDFSKAQYLTIRLNFINKMIAKTKDKINQ
ncbi:Fe-S protein assembly co-chaperone HscB [Rickettsia endosymbiont of Cardiosporidium cionae]|uniref:Fe-S protein assembly co-chaperone HscB n=1 Tax=Rickettsia endosymbiont of Cardiosporidium cionae TaxID=2777155 RepID=UPI001895AC40|nr:Fe-S protein assembly co-chaperone HscB [Rickettsia endosymbiont of Cardiosporidium cionae]KAF8818924.1 co-chaperone protein HscB [Rickettsia endosymbiont of Cardiosporidium cionae]